MTCRIACAVLALTCSLGASGKEIFGRVTRVIDGDTIKVEDDRGRDFEIRLGGIDAPEHGQAFGAESRQQLSDLLDGKRVRVEYGTIDQYGRRVGKVWVKPVGCRACGLTLDANLAQLTTGSAWWYRHYGSDQSPRDRGQYEFAEQEARAKRAGLWRDPRPIPPWEWRHAGRKSAPASSGSKGTCRIKGNVSAKGARIYHVPGQRFYEATRVTEAKGERWFCSESEARAAGWRRSRE